MPLNRGIKSILQIHVNSMPQQDKGEVFALLKSVSRTGRGRRAGAAGETRPSARSMLCLKLSGDGKTVLDSDLDRSIEEPQADLDLWLEEFNRNRPHQGRWCFCKTPMQTFLDAKPIAEEKMIAA